MRRGGLVGEDGGGCRWVGGSGEGEDDLLFWGKATCAARMRGVGMGLGCSCCLGGHISGVSVSISRKASKAASPPLMVRMFVGPCGEGADWTRHMVSGGGGQPPYAYLWGALWPLRPLGVLWGLSRQCW